MEKIRNAKIEDIESLKKLWTECFPKDIEYSKFFFEKIFRLECARVCEVEGEVAAMLHSFPRTVCAGKESLSAKYIYGVGTSKAFRGHGIAGRLLESEAKECDVLLLIPQSESLFEFYKRYGFTHLAHVDMSVVTPSGSTELRRATEADIPYLNEVYERELSGFLHTERDEKTWKLLLSEFEFLGGGFYIFRGGYCAQYKNGEKIEIVEFFSDVAKECEIAGAFGEECVVTTTGEASPLAVLKPVSDRGYETLLKYRKRYINLMHN